MMNILNYFHSFVIPYHANKELLYLTVNLLQKTLPRKLHYEIIIIANNKNSSELVLNLNDPLFKVIKVYHDLLYAKAINLGVENAIGDFITLCDQDIFYLPGWYGELFKLYVSSPKIGAVSAKLLNPTNNRIIDFGVAYSPNNSTHPTRGISANSKVASFDRKVQAACSAILMTNKELFLSVGGMDHDMAYLCCDCDYCIKIAEKGYETWVAANAIVYHKGSSSNKNTKNSKYSYYSTDASNMFYAKCFNKIKYDMKEWITYVCYEFKSNFSLKKRYILVDLTTIYDFDWYIDNIKSSLNIIISDTYKYNVGERKIRELQLYDHITLNLIDSVLPIIYFVDVLGSLEHNKLWCHLRDIKNDIVIDINGNIDFLSEINVSNY